MENKTIAKITMTEKYNAIKEVLNGGSISNPDITMDMLVDFCDNRVEQIAKKSGSKSGTSKKAIENAELANQLYDVMVKLGTPVRSSALCGKVVGVDTPSKSNTILKVLINDGRVTRTVEKGVALFAVV